MLCVNRFDGERKIFVNHWQVSTLKALANTQESKLVTNSSEIAELVVKATEHDTSKTKFYIDEFAALLEKYNSAIVVHDTKEKMAAEKVATLEKQVSPKRNA